MPRGATFRARRSRFTRVPTLQTSLVGVSRALTFPGSGKSDTRRPVYWLAGSSRHGPPSQEHPSGCSFEKLRGSCARRLQLQGQPQIGDQPRCVPVTGVPWREGLKLHEEANLASRIKLSREQAQLAIPSLDAR